MKLWCKKTLSHTFFTGAQKYLAKRKLDSVGFIKAHSGIAKCPGRMQRMKSELQLADSLAQISRANKAEQALKKAAASATIEKCGPTAAVKLKKQRMDVSELTMPEICALSLRYFNTEIPKGNIEMVVRAFAVLMEKSPGVVTVISAARIASPAVTEADSDEHAEVDNNNSQVVV
jgi:hypothetical protein